MHRQSEIVMFPKLVILTVLMVGVGAGLLGLRQRQLEMAHDSAVLYREALDTRRALWEAQIRAAKLIRPEALRRRIEKAQLALEPAVPMSSSSDPAAGGWNPARIEVASVRDSAHAMAVGALRVERLP